MWQWFTRKKWLDTALGVVFSVLLVVLGFEAGAWMRFDQTPEALVMEVVPPQPVSTEATPEATVPGVSAMTGNTESTGCLFVGSKNSNKYHSPSCSYAKNIKPENKVCFASAEDAKARGYQAGCIE